jgi:MoaA/NifB/PqqE/SkfB family radical SAM enzyme
MAVTDGGARFVVADLVVREGNCNLSCTYCLTGQSAFKPEHSLQQIFDPPVQDRCGPETDLGRRMRAVLRACAGAGTPVVKLSGGEILIVEGIQRLLEETSAWYETVVVLTNGIPLTRSWCRRLADLGNVVLQVSLDATRLPGNSYRCPDAPLHEAFMERLRGILESDLEVEIYLVLHDRSITTLGETLEDLRPWAGRVSVFPFPVRGPSRGAFQPRPEQHAALFQVLDRADRYAGLLPSPAYLDRLRRFYAEGGRRFRCHLPRVAFTAFDDGTATSCPNIWFNHAGNLLQRPVEEVYRALGEAPFRKLLLAPAPRIDACHACFTPWDPVSLYFEGELALEDVARIPMYRGERTLAALAAIKASWRTEREAPRAEVQAS